MTSYYLEPEAAVQAWLTTRVAPARVVTDPPKTTEFAASLPLVWVKRIPGTSNLAFKDRATLDIDCYAADRITARTLAYQCYELLSNELAGTPVNGGWVSAVIRIMPPIVLPTKAESMRRFGCAVQLTTHL